MVNPNPKDRSGFRLPGVLSILLGIAFASSVLIPMWFGRPAVTLNNAVDLLAKDLEELRRRASYLYADVRLNFEEDGNGYTLTDSFGTVLSAPVGPGPYQRRYDMDAVFRGVRIVNVDIEGKGEHSLQVDARGAFTNSATIELDYKGQKQTLFVDSSNGMIQINGVPRDLVVKAD